MAGGKKNKEEEEEVGSNDETEALLLAVAAEVEEEEAVEEMKEEKAAQATTTNREQVVGGGGEKYSVSNRGPRVVVSTSRKWMGYAAMVLLFVAKFLLTWLLFNVTSRDWRNNEGSLTWRGGLSLAALLALWL